MAMVIMVVVLLKWWGICYDRRWLRRLLYNICRSRLFFIVGARNSGGARRRPSTVAAYDTGWDFIVVVVFFHTDKTHDGS